MKQTIRLFGIFVALLASLIVFISPVFALPCSDGTITASCECEEVTRHSGYCCRDIWFDPHYQTLTGGCPTGNFYYVDENNPQASDSNPGTESLPWRTMKRATMGNSESTYDRNYGWRPSPNPSIAAQAGDVVIVKAGEYTAEGASSRYTPAISIVNSGTPGRPIILKASGDAIVHTEPSEFGSVQSAGERTITLDQSASSQDDYYEGWKMRITSGTGAGQMRNILANFSNFNQISYYGNTKLTYVQHPWDIIPDSSSRYSLTKSGPIMGTNNNNHVVIDGFRIEERDSYAADTGPVVLWGSSNVVFMNNDILAQPQPLYDNHNALRIEGSQDFTVRNNKIHGVLVSIDLSNNPQNHAAIMLYASNNGIIENNEIYDSYTCMFPKSNNRNITIRYNYIHNCAKCLRISGSQNTNIYQNIFYNCTSMVFQPAENNGNNQLFNNVFSNSASGINNWYASSNFSLFNNIYYNVQYPFKFESVLGYFASNYNDYYNYIAFNAESRNIGGLGEWQARGYDANSIEINPQFTNPEQLNFRLQAGSPLRSAGRDLQDYDRDGNTDEPITMGAYISGSEVIGITTGTQTPPTPDTTPPFQVTGLTATATSQTQINLAWNTATDNTGGSGVAGYRIYRNGVNIANTTTTAYSNSGLAANMTYTYTVAAYDAAGNLGVHSLSASATTFAASHAPLFFDDFEYDINRASGTDCSSFFANGWSWVKAENCVNSQSGNGYLYTVSSITGFSGTFPGQGSRALAIEARPIEGGFQTDFYLQYGDGEGAIGQIPPNHWVQFWIYPENTAEHPSYFSSQSKFLYYNRATYYPATIDNDGYVYLTSLQPNSGTPLRADPCPDYEFVCDQGFFSTTWESNPTANDSFVHGNVNNHIADNNWKLGANLVSEAHVLPNTWTLVKMHVDLTGTDPRAAPGQAVYEQWIRQPGDSAWTKTTEYFGGVTQVNGQTLDFYPRYNDGFRMLRIPTTVGSSTYPNDPRDNTREYWVYLDDFAMATSEAALPAYGDSPPPIIKAGDINTDGNVNIADLQLVVNTFGKATGQSGFDSRCDLAAPIGTINLFDVMVVVRNWG